MTNDTPPRACLADFGFMTMVLDPIQPMACSAQLEGGTTTFMAPELLAPSRYGKSDSVPTPESDVYAFGLVILQVCERDRRYRAFTYIAQVLTGETPFRGVRQTELGYSTVQGVRPDKPENALAIGLSDLLWGFVQRCWDGDIRLRPKVVEVVTHLGEAATDWGREMPPYARAEKVTSDPGEEMSESMRRCEFNTSTAPGIAHRTTVQMNPFDHLRVFSQKVRLNPKSPMSCSAARSQSPLSTATHHRANLRNSPPNSSRSHHSLSS